MNRINVVKIGGNVIDDQHRLATFLQSFAALDGAKLLVHGGGNIATAIGQRLGIEPRFVDGRRLTDAPTLDLLTMVYGGLVNKRLVAGLQALGCNAIGLTGADANCIRATKRPVGTIDYGFVGDVPATGVDVLLLKDLLERNLTPVLAPLTHDGHGLLLNTNADTIAQEAAKALSRHFETRLIFCFDKAGVLQDPGDEQSVIPSIDKEDFENLKLDGTISGGMLPKLSNALAAVQAGVKRVSIGLAEELSEMIHEKKGTHIL